MDISTGEGNKPSIAQLEERKTVMVNVVILMSLVRSRLEGLSESHDFGSFAAFFVAVLLQVP